MAEISPDDIAQSIAENAAGPAKANIDGQQVEQHKISDQIEAHRYATARANASQPLGGAVLLKIVPPGGA